MNIPAFVWLIAVPLLASPLAYLGGHMGRPSANRRLNPAREVALAGLIVAWAPFIGAARELHRAGQISYSLGTVTLTLDGLALLLAAVALALGTLVVLYSGPYLARESGQEKYYAMLTAMVGVMVGLGCAGDLFNLWIWFEAMAVTSYLLVAFYREQPASLEAGVKYLVQSAAGSVLVLLGIGLVLAQAGTLNIAEVRAMHLPTSSLLATGALFLIGFGVKTALVPLHTWLPDAHSQAPSGISAMLSGVVIEAGLVALLRSLSALTAATPTWGSLLLGAGALNMLAGNLLALRQTHVKRLLAYSSLAHIGYMLLGLGIAVYAGETTGAQGGLFHLLNHGLMKGLAFLSAGALLYTLHIAAGNHNPLTISDLSGAARRYPWPAFTLSLALLGLAGLPPLAGFMSKWQIFAAGFQTHNALISGLVIFAALNSVLSLAYYAPLVNAVYRQELSDTVRLGIPLPLAMNVPLLVLALAVVAIGIWPDLVAWLTAPAGAALLAAFGT
ncbi:MAG: hypothetical protein Kow0063_33260 [Anaerolineae bacterium]